MCTSLASVFLVLVGIGDIFLFIIFIRCGACFCGCARFAVCCSRHVFCCGCITVYGLLSLSLSSRCCCRRHPSCGVRSCPEVVHVDAVRYLDRSCCLCSRVIAVLLDIVVVLVVVAVQGCWLLMFWWLFSLSFSWSRNLHVWRSDRRTKIIEGRQFCGIQCGCRMCCAAVALIGWIGASEKPSSRNPLTCHASDEFGST